MLRRIASRIAADIGAARDARFLKNLQLQIDRNNEAAVGARRKAKSDDDKSLSMDTKRRLDVLLERYRESGTSFQAAVTRLPQTIVSMLGILRLVIVGMLGFLALFLVHQLLIWASVDPADAFERAKTLFAFIEILWDTTANVLNAFIDLINTLVPAWNMVSDHVVEPAVYIVIDVFFIIFLRRPYEGLLDENTLSYKGFVCDPASRPSSKICGDFAYYYSALSSGQAAGTGVVNGSIVLSSATARRLSEALTEPLVGEIDMKETEKSLTALVTMVVVVGAQIADAAMHVVYTIASEALTLILDAVIALVNVVIDVMMMLVRSGLLEKLLFLAIDLFVIYFIEIQLPYLFLQLDGLLCLVNIFFGQNTWDAQLECAAYHSNPMRSSKGRTSCTVFVLGLQVHRRKVLHGGRRFCRLHCLQQSTARF